MTPGPIVARRLDSGEHPPQRPNALPYLRLRAGHEAFFDDFFKKAASPP